MPDIADDRAAFQEAMRRAEASSGIERDAEGNETNGIEAIMRGETPGATELEGAVPIAASDQPLELTEPAGEEPAAISEEQPETPAASAAPTIEELQAQIALAQEQLATKDSFIGRQSGEVGELRKVVDELSARVSQAQVTPAPTVAITQELIDDNPARATALAFEQKNEQALGLAFEAWKDEDPFTAGQWLTDKRLGQQRDEFNSELEKTRQQIETATAPLAQTADQAAWNTAFKEVEREHADLLKVDEATGKTNVERILDDVAPQFPDIAEKLANGDAKVKTQALKALYALDRLGSPERFAAELKTSAEEAAAEAAAARAAAGVVSTQATTGQGSVEKTEEQEEQDAYKARMTATPSLSRGWTGRS